MTKANDQTSQAKTLYQSGFTAFQNKAYKESIDYFKRAQSLGLNFLENAEANRFIGHAYLELHKTWQARKYLRQATVGGMFSGNSILMLAHAEEYRSWLYKWIKGDDYSDKVEELLDWFLMSDVPNENSLNLVALKAFTNKKWFKAIVLFETLRALDKSNTEYQKYFILSCYNAGELYRARVEIEAAFSDTTSPILGLLKTRADISMIFGEFDLAKEYYTDASKADKKDNSFILKALEAYILADQASEQFHKTAIFFLTKDYFAKSYVRSIDNIDHFELMLNAVSTYFEHFQNELTEKNKNLQEHTRAQAAAAREIYIQKDKVKISEAPKPGELLTPFERMHKRQISEMEAVGELQKLNPIMNTLSNFSFANELDSQVWKTRIFLKIRLQFYKVSLAIFRVLLFLIPLLVFVDGLYGAITGNNLLTLIFPSILTSSTPGNLQIFFAVTWFLLLIFADSVLEEKINSKLVDTVRTTLIDYVARVGYILVAGEAAYEFLLASQPIPHLGMKVSELLEIGLNQGKPREIRSGALIMAGKNATSSEITPYKERLIAELSPDNEKFRFISASLLAIGKFPESLSVIESELKKDKNETNNSTVFNIALQSLAKYGDTSSSSILRDFIIYNLEDFMKKISGIQAIKLLPLELRISTVIEILELSLGKKSEFHTFLELLNGLGDPVVNPLVAFYNKHHEELYGFDGYEVLLAVLNSESKIGSDVVKKWLVGSEPSQTEKVYDMNDMRYEFFIGRKKFNLISDIAFDENLSVNVRKKAAYYIAFLEKEKLQDVVFRLWQSDELSEVYVKTLGDVGTPACAEKLSAFLEKSRDTIDDTVGKTEYSYVYSALALCGEAGKDKLRFLVNNAESLKVERLFALAALYGINQSDFASLRKLKKLLFDKDINEYHRSHVFWVMEWCIQREDDIEFKLHQHRKPSPIKYYQFLKWASQNSKLPEQVHVMAEFALSSSSFKEYDRELHLPKSYNKIEIYWEKIKSKISDKKK